MSGRAVRSFVAAAGVATALLACAVVFNSLSWIDRTFPGFMLLENRVVPSIALPHWANGRAPLLFQSQVRAVDGKPVASADEVYEIVDAAPPGRSFAYRLRSPWGAESVERVSSVVFGAADWLLLFGAFLVNGVVFVAIGLLVFRLSPERPASAAVLVATASAGLFVLTAIDLYGPHLFFRLHVLAECAMGAGFLHLALVFPTERLRERRRRLLALIYGVTGGLILAYETLLSHPTAYTILHLAASTLQVIGCVAMVAAIVHDFFATSSPLVRRRIGVVALGATAGMVVPALLWAASAVLGGGVSVNAAAFSAFLFPLSLGYAVIQRDLFEIDLVLRRSITYVVVVVATVSFYIALLAMAGWTLDVHGFVGERPALVVAFNVVLLFALSPIRSRVQEGVDYVFFRRGYDPQEAIAQLSRALEGTRDVGAVVAETTRLLVQTFFPQSCVLFEVDEHGALQPISPPEPGSRTAAAALRLPAELRHRLEAGRATSRYAWEDEPRDAAGFWHLSGAEVVVPVRHAERTQWIVALGAKESGYSYNLHDSALLETMARQVALAMATARAFGDLERLNADLERQVEGRTRELGVANRELEGSVARLRRAYAMLEESQKSLVRADRLATLGRLTAGIAHEVNTPLGAVMNALQLLQDLAREYAESIADPAVTPDDHRQIAKEISDTAASAAGWAGRAATFVSRVKGHGREPLAGESRPFTIAEVAEEVRCLLDHRLQASTCRLVYAEEPAGVDLVGDPARLGHVLLNLIQNAVEAYDEQGAADGRIEVSAVRDVDGEGVVVEVRDYAGGVPAEIAERIFEELFTTKEPGKGTGLGLWIVRNVVEQAFGGEISLRPVAGPGTCFHVVLRSQAAAEQRPAKSPDDLGATGH
jgi:signal transduction histidine kinase